MGFIPEYGNFDTYKTLYGSRKYSLPGMQEYHWYTIFKRLYENIHAMPDYQVISLVDGHESKAFHSELGRVESEMVMVTGAFQPFAFSGSSVKELDALIRKNGRITVFSGSDIVLDHHENSMLKFINQNIANENLQLYKLPLRPYIHFRIFDQKYLTFEAPHEEVDVIRIKFNYQKQSQRDTAISIFSDVLKEFSRKATRVSSIDEYNLLEFTEMIEEDNLSAVLLEG